MRLRIRFQRRSDLVTLLTLALLVMGFLGYLAWVHEEAAASAPKAPQAASLGLRQYYITKNNFLGNQALTACASGYHMASLWEILDPSNLKYNRTLGETQDDSGQGPPTFYPVGWVRTGYIPNFTTIAGQANCDNWTDGSTGYSGTTAKLPIVWEDAPDQDVGVWDVEVKTCNLTYVGVWCVADVVGHRLYLAIVKK